MLIISVVLYLLFSFLLYVPCYGRFVFSKILQFTFLLILSLNTILHFILDLFCGINKPYLFLLFQIIFCTLILVCVIYFKHLTFRDYLHSFKGWGKGLKWLDYVLIGAISLILAAFFVVGITTPPNNVDSLDPTRITQVFYWLQAGTFASSHTNLLSLVLDPILINLQGIWLFSLGKSENLFFLVQWMSLVIAIVTVFQISRLLKFSISNALISALISLTFPVVLLQTYSFQGDLTVAVLVLISIAQGLSFLIYRRKMDLAGSILAFILAIGCKNAALMTIPIFGIFILFLVVFSIKKKKIVPWLAAALSVIVILGVGVVGNSILKNKGSIAGIQVLSSMIPPAEQTGAKLSYNIPRFAYQFVGLDGLPRVIQKALIPVKTAWFKNWFDAKGLDLESESFLQVGFDEVEKFSYTNLPILSDEFAWFGPLCFLLLPLALVIAFFSKEKPRRIYALFCLILFVSFFFMVLLQRPGWDPYQGRYFILSILPIVPLVSILIPDHKLIRPIIMILIISSSLFLSENTLCTNSSKPLVTAGTFWNYENNHILTLPENNKLERYVKNKLITNFEHIANSALDRQTIYKASYWTQVYFSSFDRLTDIEFIDPLIPNGETLYLDVPSSALDYGLFGRYKDRKLIRVNNISEVESGFFLTWVFSTIPTSTKYQLLGENSSYKIIYVSNNK